MNTHARQQGFTMVEVLVALVVLAIGLLGIAALYLNSLQAGRTAIYRTRQSRSRPILPTACA
jgi:type IV pilus assembly protein PilV